MAKGENFKKPSAAEKRLTLPHIETIHYASIVDDFEKLLAREIAHLYKEQFLFLPQCFELY